MEKYIIMFGPILTHALTLYNLRSGYIFSIQFSIHLQWYWNGEFVKLVRPSLFGDHFPYSHDLIFDSTVMLWGEIRCQSLLGIEGLRANDTEQSYKQLLAEVFMISRIIKVEVGVICRSRRLITLIIMDITKTEANNCFIIH